MYVDAMRESARVREGMTESVRAGGAQGTGHAAAVAAAVLFV